MLERLHQPPEESARPDSEPLPPCWSLALVRLLCPEMSGLGTDSGVLRRMQRWRISWKMGRLHLVSPDPDYTRKLEAIAAARARAADDPARVRVLYADEVTFYRRPERGRNWHRRGGGGRAQPTTKQAPGSNTKRRVIGALDTVDGRVCSMSRSVIGVRALIAFLHQLRKHYGPDMELVVVWDNWPPHHHPEVLAAAAMLKIVLLNTPTYAPWTNPIEKLWDKLKDEVPRLHRLSDKWVELRKRVDRFLEGLLRPNPGLLRHVGLLPN